MLRSTSFASDAVSTPSSPRTPTEEYQRLASGVLQVVLDDKECSAFFGWDTRELVIQRNRVSDGLVVYVRGGRVPVLDDREVKDEGLEGAILLEIVTLRVFGQEARIRLENLTAGGPTFARMVTSLVREDGEWRIVKRSRLVS
jgi:hypothetical protein